MHAIDDFHLHRDESRYCLPNVNKRFTEGDNEITLEHTRDGDHGDIVVDQQLDYRQAVGACASSPVLTATSNAKPLQCHPAHPHAHIE